MPVVTMKNLLEAGVHFGHQTRRWNPKMKPYIFTERSGIYILDLQRTLRELEHSFGFARSVAQKGGTVLFVGTKKQAQEPIQSEAERSGMPYVNHRWLGGMLTNFVTMRGRVARMEQLEAMEADGRMATLPKKEQLLLKKELGKLQGQPRRRAQHDVASGCDLRRRHQARGHRDPRGPASAHPDHRPGRHQRRSR